MLVHRIQPHDSNSHINTTIFMIITTMFLCHIMSTQNELILVSVLDVIYETILSLLRGQLDRRTILDNLELVLLTIDEVVSQCDGNCVCIYMMHVCLYVCT